jgi:NADH:ubiquinone oxidoreductase subunit 6 (subunit J)
MILETVALELVAVGLVISACLAIFLEEAVHSVVALAGAFFFTALLFLLNGAVFVAIFQFAVGVGTLAVLFLSGEMLTEKFKKKTSLRTALTVLVAGAFLGLPAVFLSIPVSTATGYGVSFEESLWSLRAPDVVLQGLVVMVVAIGIAIVLHDKKKGET